PPAGIVQVSVDAQTGFRWSPGCTGQPRTEYFLSGTEPMSECLTYGDGWFMNAMGQWEYRGLTADSLGYGSAYGTYGGYGAYPDAALVPADSDARVAQGRLTESGAAQASGTGYNGNQIGRAVTRRNHEWRSN